MNIFKSIDETIQKGYALLLEDDLVGGCDKWLDAWTDMKTLLAEGVAKDIYDLDQKYDWTDFVSNFVQDLEIELRNAGLKDNEYHLKRAVYCEELLQWCGGQELIISNTRRGMAEGYYHYGDTSRGERLFADWLQNDPDWGWGYIGLSDCYRWGRGVEKQVEKAEEVLLTAYARDGLRDRVDVVDRLVQLYEDRGDAGKAKAYKKIERKLAQAVPPGNWRYKPAPAKSEKIGRNDPCPCGSGKKYKKCCGA